MFKNVLNSLKLPEVRKRFLFTFLVFLVIQLGHYIIVPGINRNVISDIVSQSGFLGLLDLFSGGGYRNFSVLSLGVLPYINASIILQLLQVVIPSLEKLVKEGGEEGRRKIAKYTNWLTLGLGLLQSYMFTNFVFKDALTDQSILTKLVVIVSLVAGGFLLIWLGEMVTEKGIGNGVSLIIFVGIIGRIPLSFTEATQMLKGGSLSYSALFFALIVSLVALMGIIFVYQAERRIAVQYSKRIVGRRMYGGQSTYIPLKLVQAGVLPIIFASSVLTFPGIISQFLPGTPFAVFVTKYLTTQGSPVFNIGFFLLVVFFTYFYTSITYNPADLADNLQKYGGFVPGVRPGKITADYIQAIISRITFPASIFLAALAVLPNFLLTKTNLSIFYFGGTSILIMIGVVIETANQLEAFLVMRQYKGFLKGWE